MTEPCVGDALLQAVADRFSAALAKGQTLARLGGDEYAVLLPATGTREAEGVAARLLALAGEPFLVGGVVLEIDATLGLAVGPEHGRSAEELLRRADIARYDPLWRAHLPRRRGRPRGGGLRPTADPANGPARP